MGEKKIFLVTYGGGHVNVIVPIVKELMKKFNYRIILLALTTAPKVLDNHKIKYLQLKDLVNQNTIDNGIQVGKKYHNPGIGISEDETYAYYGIGIEELRQTYGDEIAEIKFLESGRKSFLPINFMKRTLADFSPDLVITTSSPRFEKATLLAAHTLQIPAIRIEQLFSPQNDNLPNGLFYCVINEYVKEKLVSRGVNQENIHVTGQPAFDKISHFKTLNSENLKEEFGYQINEKIILWISPGNKKQDHIIRELITLEKKYKDYKLIIKLHPNENGDAIKDQIKAYNSRAEIFHSKLQELIIISDVVITEFSAVGLEAIILDKPLITINLTGEEDRVAYAETGAALGVDNLNDLDKIVFKIFYDLETKENLGKNRKKYKNDGKATERIVKIVETLLK